MITEAESYDDTWFQLPPPLQENTVQSRINRNLSSTIRHIPRVQHEADLLSSVSSQRENNAAAAAALELFN